jgi:transposase
VNLASAEHQTHPLDHRRRSVGENWPAELSRQYLADVEAGGLLTRRKAAKTESTLISDRGRICWLAQGEWRPHPSRSRPAELDGLSDWLRERFRLHGGNTNAVRQELAREKNITVSLRTVERAVAPLWREFFLVERARQVAFEWMRSVLQKDISLDALRREVGNVPDIETLLQRLYDGRLSDRNRSMIVLANRRGLSNRIVCSFLGISKNTHRKCQRMFEDGGCAALFSCQIRSTRKFSNEAIKQAVFGLLHEPPSNYGINRTTWIMSDLSWVLRETGYPVCQQVIRTITKAAGYRWRKARIVLTSSDPNYTEKLDRIRSILSGLRSDEAFFSIDEFGPFAVKMNTICGAVAQRPVRSGPEGRNIDCRRLWGPWLIRRRKHAECLPQVTQQDGIAVRVVSPVIIESTRWHDVTSSVDQPQRPFIRNILWKNRAWHEEPKAHLLHRSTSDLGKLRWRAFDCLTSNQISPSPCPHNMGLRLGSIGDR